jgi:hypothetical protein
MVHCNQCGTDNLEGSEFCDECGRRLSLTGTPSGQSFAPPQPPPPPSFTRDSVAPKPATPYTAPPPKVQNSGGSLSENDQGLSASRKTIAIQTQTKTSSLRDDVSPGTRAKLVIQRGGKVGKEFPLSATESLIGRWDADGGIFPDIDLDQDDPEAKVSRRHARIACQNNQFLIEDLGSTNGTFINRGPRLLPGTRQSLNNGDEIIVGKTFLKFVLS